MNLNFSERDWLNPEKPKPPVFWIKTLRIHAKRSPEPGDIIREIPFGLGLNIIWAEPAPADEQERSKRGKGHSAGKTTLCRFIRYALCEDSYGRDTLRQRLANSDTLNAAWISAEIIVGDESWIVARPLYSTKSFCLRDQSLDQIFSVLPSERLDYSLFRDALETAVQRDFAITQFETDSKAMITWQHSLQWLTRDQESQLGDLFDWRSSKSQSNAPELSADHAHLLTRVILGITNQPEQEAQQQRKKLLANRKKHLSDSDYRTRLLRELIQDLQETLPSEIELPDVSDELFFDSVEKNLNERKTAFQNSITTKINDLKIPKLEKALEKALKNEWAFEATLADISKRLDNQKKSLEKFLSVEIPSEKDLEEFLNSLPPARGHCEVPYSTALFRCPILQDHYSQKAGIKTSDNQDFTEQIEILREEGRKSLNEIEQAHHAAAKNLCAARLKKKKAKEALSEIRNTQRRLKNTLSRQDQATDLLLHSAGQAGKQLQLKSQANEKIDQIKEDLETNNQAIANAQREERAKQGRLQEIFHQLVQNLKGKTASGSLNFTNQNIEAHIHADGERDSPAYVALSCILFDYMALIARFHDSGHHPGFLLHDSPRVAEMEASLYLPLFDLMAKLEKQAPNSFQYIISTTKAPPKNLRDSDHLRLPLDGATEDGRLLRTNL